MYRCNMSEDPQPKSIGDLLEEAQRRISRYEPDGAATAADSGAVLVDTRCRDDQRKEGLIPGAVRIPRTVLEWRADPQSEWRDDRIADYSRELIVFCNDGFSSSLAAANLKRLGFSKVGDVVGGYRAWKAAGLPTEEFD